MKYILIDTNCLATDLLQSDGDNDMLESLEFWLNNQFITLLVPEVIKNEEWPKVRDMYLKKFPEKYADLMQIAKKSISPVPTFVKLQVANSQTKASRITKLLDNGLFYEPSDKVKVDVVDRQRKHLAPFHNKERSTADGLIYFSTIEYIQQQKVDVLYFVSRNTKDFTQPNDKQKLHSHLVVENIEIRFYPDLGFALNELKMELPAVTKSGAFETNTDYVNQFTLLENIETLSTIDQLYQSLDRYHDQLPFIPNHILCRIAPFKVINARRSHTYHSSFTINSNNAELVKLLTSIQINKNNNLQFNNEIYINKTIDYENKVREIYRRLNGNLIHYISSYESRKEINIRLHENSRCDCVRCTFNRLEFYTSLTILTSEAKDRATEKLKYAFVHYQYGNFSASLKMFFELYEYSKEYHKSLLGFICLYNLKRLQHLIKGYSVHTDSEVTIILGYLNDLPLDSYMLTLYSESNFVRENMKWIAENGFYHEAFRKIVELVEKIRNHYLLQLRGGKSNNSYLRALLAEFLEIETYLNANCIIYNHYTEFSDLFDRVLEGLFMSYAMNERQSSRLESFDDYLLIKIITYAQTDKLVDYFNRFKLLLLKYAPSTENDKTLENTILQFLRDYHKISEISNEKLEEKGYFFRVQHRRILLNIFAIVSIVDFDVRTVILIAEAFIPIISKEDVIHGTENKYLAGFIYRKGQHFSRSAMTGFLNTSIRNHALHEGEVFEALKFQITNHHKELLINERETYNLLIEYFFAKCPKCLAFHHHDILISIYYLLTEDLQKDVSEKIKLHVLENNNFETYYYWAIYELIDFLLLFDKYVNHINVPDIKETYYSLFNDKEASFTPLNELLNLCFKYDVNLRQPMFDKFKGINPYYDWLLDMKIFDYSQFDPEWILEYPTDYYLGKIFEVPEVKSYLRTYLRKTKHPKLSEYFIKFS